MIMILISAGQEKINQYLSEEEKRRFTRTQQPISGPVKMFFFRFLRNLQTEFEKSTKLKPK